MSRPEPNAEGKIPCDCCNHNGMRKDMQTKELYLCNYCNGTHMRIAPPHYTWDELKEEPPEPMEFDEWYYSHSGIDTDVVYRDDMDRIESAYNAGQRSMEQ